MLRVPLFRLRSTSARQVRLRSRLHCVPTRQVTSARRFRLRSTSARQARFTSPLCKRGHIRAAQDETAAPISQWTNPKAGSSVKSMNRVLGCENPETGCEIVKPNRSHSSRKSCDRLASINLLKFLLLLFAMVLPEIVFGMSTQSRLVAVKMDIFSIKVSLDAFAADCSRYPTTSEGFNALMSCPTNVSGGRWRGPYLDRIPIDPWGNGYVYRYPGIHNTNGFDLYSLGPDGVSKSGGGDLDDINNWDPASPHGGDYSGLSYGARLLGKLRNSAVFGLSLLLFPIALILGVARLIAALFSQSARDAIARHPTASGLRYQRQEHYCFCRA